MSLQSLALELLSALTSAAGLFVVASGITLVFGAMRIINLAHGSFYMYGAFFMSTLIGAASSGWFWLALVAVPLAVALLGVAVDLLVLRRVYAKEHLLQLLATYALLLILADLGLRIWGVAERTVSPPPLVAGKVAVLEASFPAYNFFVVGAALVVGLGLWLLLKRTLLGWHIRAAVEDPETLAAGGANVPMLFTAVFGLGALLAGLGGALIAPLQAIAPGMDVSIIVSAFIVAVIGGLGSVAGAALGAVIIGLFEALGTLWAPTWASAFVFLAMIIVLVVRPSGLLGTAGSE
jgi:branched-subunit amino acid ABC-type transport system permease component